MERPHRRSIYHPEGASRSSMARRRVDGDKIGRRRSRPPWRKRRRHAVAHRPARAGGWACPRRRWRTSRSAARASERRVGLRRRCKSLGRSERPLWHRPPRPPAAVRHRQGGRGQDHGRRGPGPAGGPAGPAHPGLRGRRQGRPGRLVRDGPDRASPSGRSSPACGPWPWTPRPRSRSTCACSCGCRWSPASARWPGCSTSWPPPRPASGRSSPSASWPTRCASATTTWWSSTPPPPATWSAS